MIYREEEIKRLKTDTREKPSFLLHESEQDKHPTGHTCCSDRGRSLFTWAWESPCTAASPLGWWRPQTWGSRCCWCRRSSHLASSWSAAAGGGQEDDYIHTKLYIYIYIYTHTSYITESQPARVIKPQNTGAVTSNVPAGANKHQWLIFEECSFTVDEVKTGEAESSWTVFIGQWVCFKMWRVACVKVKVTWPHFKTHMWTIRLKQIIWLLPQSTEGLPAATARNKLTL